MSYSLSDIQKLLPSCCEVDAVSHLVLSEEENNVLSKFSKNFSTVLVFAHHVRHSWEWIWFEFDSISGGFIPPADLHLIAEIERIKSMLHNDGFTTHVLPYPGQSGVRFKNLADKTGLGKIGDNFLFLHRTWGTWTHLRVMLTDAIVSDALPMCETVCVHCGKCEKACPSGAIQQHLFDGKKCGEYQQRERTDQKGNPYEYECEICVRACPVGNLRPRPITIAFQN